MKKVLATAFATLFVFLIAASAYAENRPHEGKITRIDQPAMMLTVQGEKGDSWDVYLTQTTKLKKKLTFGELREGDSVYFLSSRRKARSGSPSCAGRTRPKADTSHPARSVEVVTPAA